MTDPTRATWAHVLKSRIRPVVVTVLVLPVAYWDAWYGLSSFGPPGWTWPLYPPALLAAAVLFGLFVTLATAAWPPARRDRLFHYLEAVLRCCLAFLFIFFGMAKLYPGQFRMYNRDLDMTLAEVPARRLAWRFLGYSALYNGFIASTELLAGTLLCFRPTIALGSVVGLAVMANVVVIDYAFGIRGPLPVAAMMLVTSILLLTAFPDYVRALVMHSPSRDASGPVPGPRRMAGSLIILAVMLGVTIHYGVNTTAGLRTVNPPTGRWDIVRCDPDQSLLICQPRTSVLYLEIGRWGELVLGSKRHRLSFAYDPVTDSVRIDSLPASSTDVPIVTLRGRLTATDSTATLEGSGPGVPPFKLYIRRTRMVRWVSRERSENTGRDART